MPAGVLPESLDREKLDESNKKDFVKLRSLAADLRGIEGRERKVLAGNNGVT